MYKDELISMWGIQDALLQSYRSIFLTSQSILFGIIAVIATKYPILALLLSPIGFCIVHKLWKPICKGRGYDVWFFHLQLLYYEKKRKFIKIIQEQETSDKKGEETCEEIRELEGSNNEKYTIEKCKICSGNIKLFDIFKNWQAIKPEEKEKFLKYDTFGKKLLESPTRKKMEEQLPNIFYVLWAGLFVLALFNLTPSPMEISDVLQAYAHGTNSSTG
jgi:hypothetical protein